MKFARFAFVAATLALLHGCGPSDSGTIKIGADYQVLTGQL